MELRQLSYFVAVAEELHFARAAAKVHIAQPALSNQLMALKMELGVQLLIRTTRRVKLTKAGAAFYERAVRILSEIARNVDGETTRRRVWHRLRAGMERGSAEPRLRTEEGEGHRP